MGQLQQQHATLTVGATPAMLQHPVVALNQIAAAHHLQQAHHMQQLQAGISAALEVHRHNAVSSYMLGAQRALEVAAVTAAQHAFLFNPYPLSHNHPHEMMAEASTTAGAKTLSSVHVPSHHRKEGRSPKASGTGASTQPQHDYLDQMDSRQQRQLDRLARGGGGGCGARRGRHD
jgi:hypothetical protein